jgi:hypothetical protein
MARVTEVEPVQEAAKSSANPHRAQIRKLTHCRECLITFGVLAGHRHEMKAAGVAQRVDREMYFLLAVRPAACVYATADKRCFSNGLLIAHGLFNCRYWAFTRGMYATFSRYRLC